MLPVVDTPVGMLSDPTVRVLQLINHDSQYELTLNQSGVEPIILNKFDLTDSDYIDHISDLIFSSESGADFIARCQCGDTEGNEKSGMVCPICGTTVAINNLLDDDNLICRNWLSAPRELPNGWLTPKIYLTLVNWLSYDKNKKRNYLDDILDVDADLPHDLADVIDGRGFAYLYDNFDRIIEYFAFQHPVISKKPDTKAIRFCLSLNKDRIFCHYVPILNSAMSPIFISDSGGQNNKKCSDVTADHILRAAISLSRLEFSPKKKDRLIHAERTAFKAFKDIIAYVEESTKKYISVKKAIPRTHIFGSRCHWSFRGVVVPIVGEHYYYEIHMPWSMAVNLLRVHILGALCREYGYSINQATAKHAQSLQIVDPLIGDIMDRMIEDSPFPGLGCVWDRPPSIRDGSVMLKFITKIKRDIHDSSVGISQADTTLPNADFD